MLLVAILKYIRPLSTVDELLPSHKEYLKKMLAEGKLLVAGKLNPRTGGVIVAKNISRSEFEKILGKDPFNQVSEHQILEFTPTFYDECLKGIIKEPLD